MYKINVLTLRGVVLNYTVREYLIKVGDFVVFLDPKTKKVKRFHSSRCEIDEVPPYV